MSRSISVWNRICEAESSTMPLALRSAIGGHERAHPPLVRCEPGGRIAAQ